MNAYGLTMACDTLNFARDYSRNGGERQPSRSVSFSLVLFSLFFGEELGWKNTRALD